MNRPAARELAVLFYPDVRPDGFVEDVVARADRAIPFIGRARSVFTDAAEQLAEQFLLLGVERRRLVDSGDGDERRRGDLAAPAGGRAIGGIVPQRIVVTEREGEVRD